jgi:uncharacterized membrane protein YeaQ/YmgE (transglycosylase-associated protein family)
MLLGLLLGVVATLVTKKRDSGLYAACMSLGLIGAMAGGYIGTLAGVADLRYFEWISLLPAGAGAILLIVGFMIARRPRYH